MFKQLASQFPRLASVGACYLALTVIEIIFFQNQLTFLRVVGVALQAGFAAALIYGGVAHARQHAPRYGFSTSR